MLMLGTSLAGNKEAMIPTPTKDAAITSLTLQNGEYDHMYVTKNTKDGFACGSVPTVWDYDTILNAGFNGNLYSGNISDDLANADFLRIKRRKKNTYSWITLWEVDPRSDDEGWQFTRYDKTARSLQDYDYAVVPVAGGIEGNLNITPVYSCFDGIYVFEGGAEGKSYYTLAEWENPIVHNREATVVTTLGRKLPFTISNGASEFDSGTASGIFAPCDWHSYSLVLDKNAFHRDEVMSFLTNGNVKLLKQGNGRIWLCQITGEGPREETWTSAMTSDLAKISFDWAQNADAEVGHDLYTYGYIECDIDDISIN